MKTDLTLEQLAARIAEDAENKKDLITDTSNMSVFQDPYSTTPKLLMEMKGQEDPFAINDYTHGQICEAIEKLPRPYYNHVMQDDPELLARIINRTFTRKPKRRMIRTMKRGDEYIWRAFLSDKYRRIDNDDVTPVIFTVFNECEGLIVKSASVTETKLYLKVVYPKFSFETRKGDIVQSGLMITNSEVGSGRYSTAPWFLRKTCDNGQCIEEYGINKNHIGKRIEGEGQDVYELFREATLKADDASFLMMVEDVTRAALNDANKFQLIANKMIAQTEEEIKGDIPAAVELLAEKNNLGQEAKSSILNFLLKSKDHTRYGLTQAVTATARDDQNKMSYDDATDLERLGGRVFSMGDAEWAAIANAKPVEAKVVSRKRNVGTTLKKAA